MNVHPQLQPFVQQLAAGDPVRAAFFGDSITAVHFHTGSRMSYVDLVGRGLRQLYPQAQVELINAGQSGNRTEQGLQRMQRDVLDHKPHLVSIMFGMNDQVALTTAQFAENLRTMASRCREAGAAMLLCTQNNMRDGVDLGTRDNEKLARFEQTIRDVAAELDLPLADSHRVYEDLREQDPTAWRLMLLEPFHPALHGHRLFARVIVETITGQAAPREALLNTHPAIPHALETAGRTGNLRATLIGVPEEVVRPGLELILPHTTLQFDVRDIGGMSLSQVLAEGATATAEPLGDLVFVCLPPDAQRSDALSYGCEAELIKRRLLPWRNAANVPKRDMVLVLPSVLDAALAGQLIECERAIRLIASGADAGFIRRPTDNVQSPAELVSDWLDAQTQPSPVTLDDLVG